MRRNLVDAALAAVALATTLALIARDDLAISAATGGLSAIDVLLAGLASLPLLAWRRAPLAVFAVTAGASALLAALGDGPGLAIGPAIAIYLLAASGAWTRVTTAWVLGLFAAWMVAAGMSDGRVPANAMFHGGLAYATAWFAGERTRLRRAQIAGLEERARRAEREAESERRLAVAEERARIARDLHDSAGHAINVIGVLAGAARLRRDPNVERTLETIEELARETVGELDQILHTLRDRTPPGLASLATLVAQHTSSGLAVTVEAPPPPRPLASAVDQAAYRILQEALTNAARHGTGTARVELTFRDAAVELTVVNPVGAGRTRSSGGHGLIGMRERATLTGGTLTAGAVDGAFRVHAELPYRP